MLLDRLPERYAHSPEVVEIEAAMDTGMQPVTALGESILLQLNVDTATWGLAIWERQYGIPTEAGRPLAFRRSRIKAKMRGTGTTTPELIHQISESFVNGEVAIEEHNEIYTFDVRMMSLFGVPPNMEDLMAAIEEAKPAHLAVRYIYRFRTHMELRPYTHKQLAQFTHAELRERGVIDGR